MAWTAPRTWVVGEFAQLLRLGHEQQGVEYKGPGLRSDGHFFARVARAVLGMANRRDGGYVVIGVDQSNGGLNPIGLTDEQLATWKYDDVAASLAEYADPSVSFDLATPRYNDKSFLVLEVREFEEIPVLCNRDYPDVLRKGACYVRSRRKPETSEIPSQEDMRELLDLATDKGVKKWVARTRAAGLLGWPPATPAPSDEERFHEQAKDLL